MNLAAPPRNPTISIVGGVKITCSIRYTSPAGRNRYANHQTYSTEDVEGFVNQSYALEKERKTKEYQRKFLTLDCAEEMADVMEVLYAMGKTCAVSKREIEQVRSQKAAEKGTFSKKIFLVSTGEERREP